jgi:hypothetical protein
MIENDDRVLVLFDGVVGEGHSKEVILRNHKSPWSYILRRGKAGFLPKN